MDTGGAETSISRRVSCLSTTENTQCAKNYSKSKALQVTQKLHPKLLNFLENKRQENPTEICQPLKAHCTSAINLR